MVKYDPDEFFNHKKPTNYLIEKNNNTNLYSLKVNGYEIAKDLEIHEAVAMLETLMNKDRNE